MSNGPTVEFKIHLARAANGRVEIREGERRPEPAPGRVPRVARIMALSIRVEQLVRDGEVRDYAQVARLGHVSRARVSQLLRLLDLAPSIQEEILHLPPVEQGRDPITERDLRPIAAEPDWGRQRAMWEAVQSHSAGEAS